ncbi:MULTISPECIES: gas vesicle protein GvpG [unclassified Streptomyces]|uniref:Gas vesicle protein GvpG n=1 Tax=Streptomyces sp. R33 TaxID=3238629 RepID=A0AB39YI38_9ACTN|nr:MULTISPECIES: gas vesicle protein GvpG [unclassified Streptomyces]KOY57479.1 gas vesicle protein [Streptomyces sp. XY332]TDU80365.1 gas vesicle protein GvpG [Streptomyces sp. KS 21]THA39735.1 gas vesicle protein [Streptomyces sp. A1547]
MGLLTEILLLPAAPVRGTAWVLRQVVAEAERQYYDPAVVQRELAQLVAAFEAGEMDEAEFDRREDELLDRLESRVRPR